jgi:hypothetical protein
MGRNLGGIAMTEDQKYEIAVLAEDYQSKKLRHECLGMRNAHGLSAEEATRRSIEYHISEAEKLEAWANLERAKVAVMS